MILSYNFDQVFCIHKCFYTLTHLTKSLNGASVTHTGITLKFILLKTGPILFPIPMIMHTHAYNTPQKYDIFILKLALNGYREGLL